MGVVDGGIDFYRGGLFLSMSFSGVPDLYPELPYLSEAGMVCGDIEAALAHHGDDGLP